MTDKDRQKIEYAHVLFSFFMTMAIIKIAVLISAGMFSFPLPVPHEQLFASILLNLLGAHLANRTTLKLVQRIISADEGPVYYSA